MNITKLFWHNSIFEDSFLYKSVYSHLNAQVFVYTQCPETLFFSLLMHP